MWSKGAVVIVKHGDEAIADAVAKGIDIQTVAKSDVEKIERDYRFMKNRDSKYWKRKIRKANEKYAYNWRPPWWAKKTVEAFAFVVYGFSVFVDKYLRIK